ncbi:MULTISPECIES: bestrophin family protein [Methylobacterium]|uniref:bestrophin family protein n=1 Tax=Methylobacterium TaxID=407 RepID=UPI001046DAE9|nr:MULTISPECIES: bestrophin family protein [Methylobacterium]MDR7039547.1 putative membrane protein [Methylobacterium sp. BE186]
MIVRPRPGLLAILVTLHGSILPQVALKILFVTGIACLVVAAERHWPDLLALHAGVAPFTLVGLALSIFLSFRNNACYERWWEARKQWGLLIVAMRGLARTIPALLPGEAQEARRRRLLRRLSGFAHALHASLRAQDPGAAAAPWLPADEARAAAAHPDPADAALRHLAADLGEALRAGEISDVLYGVFEAKLDALSRIQAACERIKGTPLPFAYTLLIYRTSWLYCALLPFGLATSLGWATPLITALVAYTFFGLDALGDELEEPFGLEANDLPLNALLRTVDGIILDALGEPAPPAVLPESFVLQ